MNSELIRKFVENCDAPDEDGHVTWHGSRGHHGKPIIKYRGRQYPTAAVAFWIRTGRVPTGITLACCDVRHCVAGQHVMDEAERRSLRLQLRFLEGLPEPWDFCSRGHGWDEHGRVDASLMIYCNGCKTGLSRERKSR